MVSDSEKIQQIDKMVAIARKKKGDAFATWWQKILKAEPDEFWDTRKERLELLEEIGRGLYK